MDRTILIVDDNPALVDFLRMVLEMEGYIVHAAHDARECLSYLERERPGLILLDIIMTPINGWTTLERIRAEPRNKGIRVIMLTARPPTSFDAEQYTTMIDGYIMKPFNIRELLEKIRMVFEDQDRLSGIVHEAYEKGTGRGFLEEYCRLSRIVRAQKAFRALLSPGGDEGEGGEPSPEAQRLESMTRVIQQVVGIPGEGG